MVLNFWSADEQPVFEFKCSFSIFCLLLLFLLLAFWSSTYNLVMIHQCEMWIRAFPPVLRFCSGVYKQVNSTCTDLSSYCPPEWHCVWRWVCKTQPGRLYKTDHADLRHRMLWILSPDCQCKGATRKPTDPDRPWLSCGREETLQHRFWHVGFKLCFDKYRYLRPINPFLFQITTKRH